MPHFLKRFVSLLDAYAIKKCKMAVIGDIKGKKFVWAHFGRKQKHVLPNIYTGAPCFYPGIIFPFTYSL
jgi:hypothetical protein